MKDMVCLTQMDDDTWELTLNGQLIADKLPNDGGWPDAISELLDKLDIQFSVET